MDPGQVEDTQGGRSRVEAAARIMEAFAERTGLSPGGRPERYLWTDAFAVCNYLSLYRQSGSETFRSLASRLVEQVHHVLGRHRVDDVREGWISGLPEPEGEKHPTAGGLRIGKPLAERGPRDPYDARLEWDRDGQYYHYLVRWAHALTRAASVLGDETYLVWSAELLEAAHESFVYRPPAGGPARLRWKMSIDGTRALVPSEGAHDALDGLVTGGGVLAALSNPRPALDRQVRELAGMCVGRRWISDDPLGAGGLLADAVWATELVTDGRSAVPSGAAAVQVALRPLLSGLWRDSVLSLATLARSYPFAESPAARLAFRELGLAIGLEAVERLDVRFALSDEDLESVGRARRFVPLAEELVATWMAPEVREMDSWRAHDDINSVMLATALLPDEYLRP